MSSSLVLNLGLNKADLATFMQIGHLACKSTAPVISKCLVLADLFRVLAKLGVTSEESQ